MDGEEEKEKGKKKHSATKDHGLTPCSVGSPSSLIASRPRHAHSFINAGSSNHSVGVCCCCRGWDLRSAPARSQPATLLCSRAACKMPMTARSVSSSGVSASDCSSSSRSFPRLRLFPLMWGVSSSFCGGGAVVSRAGGGGGGGDVRGVRFSRLSPRAVRSALRCERVYSRTQRWL